MRLMKRAEVALDAGLSADGEMRLVESRQTEVSILATKVYGDFGLVGMVVSSISTRIWAASRTKMGQSWINNPFSHTVWNC